MKSWVTLALAVLGAMMTTACGSKNDASRENFATAIRQYLKQEGQLCLDFRSWPAVTLTKHMSPQAEPDRWQALESVGLLKGTTDARGWSRAYVPTEAGKTYLVDRTIRVLGLGGFQMVKVSSLCWAQKDLLSIDQWDKPIQLGEYQETPVQYSYKLSNVADWAMHPEVQAAFPVIRQHTGSAESQKEQRSVKLTSEGWQVVGMN